LRFRNRCGTSGNAMEIFNIFGRVAALGHTYFRVVCCCLSMFLASVLARAVHPCVALALWKLLRGCGWAMAAVCSWGGLFGAVAKLWLWETSHKQVGFAWFCTFLHKPE